MVLKIMITLTESHPVLDFGLWSFYLWPDLIYELETTALSVTVINDKMCFWFWNFEVIDLI